MTNMIVNPFPELLFFNLLAPFILRLLLGLIFLSFGLSKLSKEKITKADFFEKIGLKPGGRYVVIFASLELITGGALVVGFYTQIAAILAGLILLGTLVIKKKHPELLPSEAIYYFTLLVISVSLLLTGAGAHAIDIPL